MKSEFCGFRDVTSMCIFEHQYETFADLSCIIRVYREDVKIPKSPSNDADTDTVKKSKEKTRPPKRSGADRKNPYKLDKRNAKAFKHASFKATPTSEPDRKKFFFQGSWVTAETRAALLKLQAQLKTCKDPTEREEIAKSIKHLRRSEEKQSKRLKKKVCFRCRSGDHMLSECPEANSAER